MKWDGRGSAVDCEREYYAPWFCAVKKKKRWPGKCATETTRMRVKQCATPRVKCRERPFHDDLTIFTIESIKDLEPRYYSFQWRNCCSCATNIGLDSSRISELLQESTFFLLRQRSDSDQRSGVHRAYRCYHHHHSMACWPTARTMAANDVRANFLGSSSRRSWQSRQNVSCRISNSRCEFQTKIKPGVKNSGYCEHEQRRANLTTCPKRLQRKPTKKMRRRAIIILKEALALWTRKSRGRQRDHWNNKKVASWLRHHAAFVLVSFRIASQW